MKSFKEYLTDKRNNYTLREILEHSTDAEIESHVQDYIEDEFKKLVLHNVTTRYFHFDCWKRDGKLKSKRILATCEEHATLLFEKQYPDYAFDPPY